MKVVFAPNDLLYMAFQNSNYDRSGVKNGVVLWRDRRVEGLRAAP
jgi:hypothetical protein